MPCAAHPTGNKPLPATPLGGGNFCITACDVVAGMTAVGAAASTAGAVALFSSTVWGVIFLRASAINAAAAAIAAIAAIAGDAGAADVEGFACPALNAALAGDAAFNAAAASAGRGVAAAVAGAAPCGTCTSVLLPDCAD